MAENGGNKLDPLLQEPPSVTRDGDWIILLFGDGKYVFAQCLTKWRGKTPPLKVGKRTFNTSNLIGLPYGTVLEIGKLQLIPLPEGEEVLPGMSSLEDMEDAAAVAPTTSQPNDNRNLVDDNSSQSMNQAAVRKLREEGADGNKIIRTLIKNSSTFDSKTDFSKAKYIARKQKKHQPRCRMIRCTPHSICTALYWREPRKLMNLRADTLGQILSYANITAGCQVVVFEVVQSVLIGSLAQRMGGYGRILSVYTGQQPAYVDMLERFNLSFAEQNTIKWVHTEELFGDNHDTENDPDAADRDSLEWPCHLLPHTRAYLETMTDPQEITDFLDKRCNRFARKLTRNSPLETRAMLHNRLSDSLILATKYNPIKTLTGMFPFLAPSCPFVVFSEHMEPLAECFLELQQKNMAINLRLSDTWMREYQVLPGRTHPNMHMSQNGGFLLVGIKLDPVTGVNEMDEELRKEIREQIGGRRGKKPKSKAKDGSTDRAPKRAKVVQG